MRVHLNAVSATINGSAVATRGFGPSIPVPMKRLPRGHQTWTQTPAMGPMEHVVFGASSRGDQMYLVYDEGAVLARGGPDPVESTCTIGVTLEFAPAEGLSLEVDGEPIGVDASGRVHFDVQRVVKPLERAYAGRSGEWKVFVRPAGLFGGAPERFGVTPIRVRVLPGPYELEIRWMPELDSERRG